MIATETQCALNKRMADAQLIYGDFASSHESLGVALEEWQELCDAVRDNNISFIRHECLDLAAVLLRLHDQLKPGSAIAVRSGCHR